jgi:hypothetical protein
MKNSTRWTISYITMLIFAIIVMAIYAYEPPVKEIALPTTTPPFYYPMTDPVFIQHKNIIVSYEYIDDGRHLVAVENNGKSYILPLFPDKDSAIEFMNSYFDYLRSTN